MAQTTGNTTDGTSAQDCDARLMGRVVDGDAAAYRALVDRFGPRMYATAVRLLGDRANAEDVVQDAFIKLWTAPEMFDPARARFSTWFTRVVINRCLDIKRQKRPGALPDDWDPVDDKAMAGDAALAHKQDAAQVADAMARLPDRQRTAIVLCYFEDRSNREAAEIMELNIKALESLLVRARRTLATSLTPDMQQTGPSSRGGSMR